MPGHTVFISYSHENKRYLEELRRVLETVPRIDQVLWFDQRALDIGAQFHPAILQAMTASRLAIFLLSTDFFRSDYITRHELPYLLRQATTGAVKLACVYVTRIPQGALQRTIDLDGQPRTVTLTDYLGVNSPDKPLEACWRKSQRRAVYVEVANWVDRQLAAAPAAPPAPPAPAAAFAPLARAASRPSRQPGERYALAIALHMHGQQWSHRFSLPHAADFYHTALACPPPAQYVTQPQVVAADVAEALEDRLAELLEELNDEESFHLGQLGQLDKVERQDLRNYFLDQQICSCPEPYRREFPGLLLAGRSDMSFDAAVSTIQRGEPDNWGTLCEELKDLTARGVWPPAADEAHFWTSRYGC